MTTRPMAVALFLAERQTPRSLLCNSFARAPDHSFTSFRAQMSARNPQTAAARPKQTAEYVPLCKRLATIHKVTEDCHPAPTQ